MITNYWSNRIQDFLLGGVGFVPPAMYYIALSKTEPTADGGGVTEPIGGNYARIPIAKGDVSFTGAVDGVVKNKITLMSNETTSAWGNLPYYAIYDSALGGNLLWGGSLKNPRNMDIEMQLVIEPNGISFVLGS